MNDRFILTIRAALTLAFLYFGLRKLGGFPVDVAIYEAIGFGQWPRYVTGTVETLGALALWRRGLQGPAALLLCATMVTGLAALLIWVGGPYWHMFALFAGSAIIARHHSDQIARLLDVARAGR